MDKAVSGFTRQPDGDLRCERCGLSVRAVGLGVGSHRRKHQREDCAHEWGRFRCTLCGARRLTSVRG